MEFFNIIAGFSSILALVITIVTLIKVNKISNKINSNKLKQKGKKNTQIGRDYHAE